MAAGASLTIGIDARAATEVAAGRGRVVRELIRAFATRADPHQYVCFARERWGEPLDGRFRWELIPARDPAWHWHAAASASRTCEVFLSTNSYLTVALLRCPSVAIIHDLLVFDRAMAPNRRSALIERLTLGAAARKAGELLCVSHATANDLVRRIPSTRSKIAVTPLGVSPALTDSPSAAELAELPAPGFVLAVGTLEPRKNLPRLASAYAALTPAIQSAHPLVVVGARGWRTGETLEALRSLGDRCTMLGNVSDQALAELYRRSSVFCYPSLGEGFGLPVLEAMAAGAAVVTSDVSSLPEVGGDAVEYADPRSVTSIAAALERVLRSPEWRADLGRRARRRAASFSWSRTGELTLASLQRVAAAGSSTGHASTAS